MLYITDCESVCHYCSVLKKQVPKFNKLAEDLVQTLRGVADGRTWFDLRDRYRNTTLHAISLVCLTLCALKLIMHVDTWHFNVGCGSLEHVLLLQESSHLVPLLLQMSSHLVSLLLQESSHLVSLLLQESSHLVSLLLQVYRVIPTLLKFC